MTNDTTTRPPLPRPFWTLWSATTISNLGDGMLLVALPLLASRLTRDPLSVALVSFAGTIAWMVIALPAGAFADRHDRRWIIVWSNVARLLVVGLLAVFVYSGQLNLAGLAAFALALGVGEVIADAAQPGITASLVPGAQMMRAISWIATAVLITNQFAGQGLGAVLFARSEWLPFAIDAISFAIAALLLARLRGSFRVAAEAPSATPTSMRSEVAEGLRFVIRQPVLRAVAASLGLANLGLNLGLATLVLFVQDEFGLSDTMFGVLNVIGIAGGVLGSVLAGRLVDAIGRARVIGVTLVVWSIAFMAIGATQQWWQVAALAALSSGMVAIWNIAQATLVQRVSPDEMYGRTSSAVGWIGYSTIPVGYLLGGVVGRTLGLRSTFVIGGAVIALAALIGVSQLTTSRLQPLDAEAQSG